MTPRNPFRKLPLAAVIYGLGDILASSAGFLLLPVLTRYLSPVDYGILASVSAFSLFLTFVLQLNLGNSILRFFPDYGADERRRLVGTTLIAWLVWSLVMTVALSAAGPLLFDHLFQNVRFEPYLRLGTWMALVNRAYTPLHRVGIIHHGGPVCFYHSPGPHRRWPSLHAIVLRNGQAIRRTTTISSLRPVLPGWYVGSGVGRQRFLSRGDPGDDA